MNWFVKNKITSYFITDKTGVVVTNKQSIMMYIQFIAEKNKIGYRKYQIFIRGAYDKIERNL